MIISITDHGDIWRKRIRPGSKCQSSRCIMGGEERTRNNQWNYDSQIINQLISMKIFWGNIFRFLLGPLVLLPKRDLVHAICIRSTCASMDRQPLTLQAEQTPEKTSIITVIKYDYHRSDLPQARGQPDLIIQSLLRAIVMTWRHPNSLASYLLSSSEPADGYLGSRQMGQGICILDDRYVAGPNTSHSPSKAANLPLEPLSPAIRDIYLSTSYLSSVSILECRSAKRSTTQVPGVLHFRHGTKE